jgi:hypothetical protein
VAEGIAGSTPPTHNTSGAHDRSFLMSLCEGGQQSVTITGCYKRNVLLMFLHANPAIRLLEDVVTASAASDKSIRWSPRYLVDKAAGRQPLHSQPAQPTSKNVQ